MFCVLTEVVEAKTHGRKALHSFDVLKMERSIFTECFLERVPLPGYDHDMKKMSCNGTGSEHRGYRRTKARGPGHTESPVPVTMLHHD